MTMVAILRCDKCARDQEIRSGDPADQTNGWGTLEVGGRKRDICPTCIAELGGWGHVPTPAAPASRTYTFDMAPRGSHVRA